MSKVIGILIAYCSATFLFGAAQMSLPRNALWEVVRSVCIPGQSQHRDPKPCLEVDLTGGVEKGFAVLRDPRGSVHFLLVPTTPISGIESPAARAPSATNYFAKAWDARTYIEQSLGRPVGPDGVVLAVNSALSRSQDQLHIHVGCVKPDVLAALQKNERQIGNRWAEFNVPLLRRHYDAMWISGDTLGATNPFKLLADGLPGAATDMSNYTLVVISLTRAVGARGFVILADHADLKQDNGAGGEEILDESCGMALPRTV